MSCLLPPVGRSRGRQRSAAGPLLVHDTGCVHQSALCRADHRRARAGTAFSLSHKCDLSYVCCPSCLCACPERVALPAIAVVAGPGDERVVCVVGVNQVGKSLRNEPMGACFGFVGKLPRVYATRKGLRMWIAEAEGGAVMATLKYPTTNSLLFASGSSLPSSPNTKKTQFGRVGLFTALRPVLVRLLRHSLSALTKSTTCRFLGSSIATARRVE